MQVKFIHFIASGLGVTFVALGVIGIFLPILPSTPFFLLAAWLFFKSNKRAHDWLYRQPGIGTALTKWQTSGAIGRSSKFLAIGTMLISIGLIILQPVALMLKYLLIGIIVTVALFILTRPEK